jgi:hypothetical protein
MKWSVCIPALLLLFVIARQVHPQPEGLLAPAVHARVSAGPISEMSGIVKSRRRENLYWVHNDSGDGPRLFAIDGEGNSILPTYSKLTHYGDAPERGKQQWQGFEVLYADNVDWEDIAIDDNYLYVADVGNNGNARRDLVIYALSEIDPAASTRSAVVRKLPVVYPDQQDYPPRARHFDSESLFTADGNLYLLTKHRKSGLTGGWEAGAKLYRLDSKHSDRNNVLTLVDTHPALTAATAADLSPDGQTLAVLSYEALWLFSRPEVGDQWLSAPARYWLLDPAVFRQAEALAWADDETLLIGNEQRDLFRLPLAELPGR